LLASALGVVAEAHIAKADAALLAAITAGQAALGLVYLRARAGRPIAAWIAAAFWAAEIAAVLLKGPPGPALAVVTAASLSIADSDAKWLRGLRPVVGVLVSLAAIAPWLYAIEHVTDGHFLSDSLGQDLGMKLIGAQESHGGPPFTYLVLSVMTFWPGSWLLVPALVRAWRRHDATVERFLLAWLVPAWVILELVPTKLPHYVLPLYPALALLAALALVDGVALSVGTWQRRIDVAVKVLWCGVGLLLAVVLVGLPLRFGYHVVVSGIVGAVILLLLGAAMVRHRPGAEGRIALIAAMSLAFTIPATLGVVPGLDRLWLSRAAAGLVALHPPAAGMPLVAVGYSEPSLVFLLGTDLHLMTSRSAAEILAHGGEALVSSREEPLFRQAISARGLAARPLGSVPGLDYSNGQRMVLTLYQVEPG
jgi:4-amino-4-deoxy-L-arabinose transferase-like glycosyltransferase